MPAASWAERREAKVKRIYWNAGLFTLLAVFFIFDSASFSSPTRASKPIKPQTIGIVLGDYANLDKLKAIQEKDLFGTLKMGGIGVWKVTSTYDSYIKDVDAFCSFAVSRNQKTVIQLPVALKKKMDTVLKHLKSANCNLAGVSIDNEPDRFTIEFPKFFKSYTVYDYIRDVHEIAPKIKMYLPDVYIVGLDLSAFIAVKGGKDPITAWLVPFCDANAASGDVDYVSIHYYPFNGAQKEWQNLLMGSQIKEFFNPASSKVPANCPPVILGEMNMTFQYEGGTAYPGSGGESFMGALVVPEIFSIDGIDGLFHWALVEKPPSTLGLYNSSTSSFAPLYNTYKMLSAIEGAKKIPSSATDDDIVVSAFAKDGKYTIYIGNYSPFFKRDVTISNGPDFNIVINSHDIMLKTTLSLPPFSLTQVEAVFGAGGTTGKRFSYADREVKTGPFTASEGNVEYCSVLADFSEPKMKGYYFENNIWNQNNKIATGGTLNDTNSYGTGITAKLRKENNALSIACTVSKKGLSNLCGVELPLYDDTVDRKLRDWRNGLLKGFFRVTIETDIPTTVLFQLMGVNPAAQIWDIHQKMVQSVNGVQNIDVNISDFRQTGLGKSKPISEVLKQAKFLTVGSMSPNSSTYKIHKVQICDKL